MDVTVRLDGLQALLVKEKTVGAKTAGLLTEHLLTVGGYVRQDVEERYREYSVAGGLGVQEKVFTSGLWVVQTIRQSRAIPRRRPNFGPLMMEKAFGPAAVDNEDRVLLAAALAVEEARERYWDD